MHTIELTLSVYVHFLETFKVSFSSNEASNFPFHTYSIKAEIMKNAY